jgi:uncharacterized phiE125 gp8 family phage protein
MTPIALAGPAVEPISLADMKLYLRLDGDAEDDLVAALIAAGRLTVERKTRLCLLHQSWRVRLAAWPGSRAVALPLAPVISVDAVRLVAPGGGAELVGADLCRLDAAGDPARLLLDAAVPEPAAGGAAEIDLLCGFGAGPSAVPEPLLLAIRRMAAHWFEHRGDEGPRPGPAVPADALALIAPFMRPRLA